TRCPPTTTPQRLPIPLRLSPDPFASIFACHATWWRPPIHPTPPAIIKHSLRGANVHQVPKGRKLPRWPSSRCAGVTSDKIASPHERCPGAGGNILAHHRTTTSQCGTAIAPTSALGQKRTSTPC